MQNQRRIVPPPSAHEQKHKETHNGLATRYHNAKTPEWKAFYLRMMEMNDCRMIERMVSEIRVKDKKESEEKRGNDGC